MQEEDTCNSPLLIIMNMNGEKSANRSRGTGSRRMSGQPRESHMEAKLTLFYTCRCCRRAVLVARLAESKKSAGSL
jgi:hypothetical protein